jgi:chemosensory pili system protein ChpA (sensor histidine kinase/response regulator)
MLRHLPVDADAGWPAPEGAVTQDLAAVPEASDVFEVVEAQATDLPAEVPEPEPVSEVGTPAVHVDFVDTSPFGAGLEHEHLFVDVPGQVPDLPVIENIDFSALQSLSGHATEAQAPAGVPEAEHVSPQDAQQAAPVDEVVPADEGPAEPPPTIAEAVVEPVEAVAEDAAPDATADGLAGATPDEQTRVIGSLQIGLKLYNVYLNEADEWSRRLGVCLSEWALERHEPLPSDAEALAHSLAGSSATVGFDALSGIARALEHALGAVTQHQLDGIAATEAQARLFVHASEDIRRLLHQFAAGFLKEPNPELMDALHHVVHDLPAEAPIASTFTEPDIGIGSRWSDLGGQDLTDRLPAQVLAADTGDTDTVFAPLPGIGETVETGQVQDIDDDIDVFDTIDADLFPVFADEAAELLPQLGGALRQWVARPDNGSARGEVLRNLHTLKGSARLAGALRLGEMVHRMETQAERLGSDVRRSADVEPLQHAFDAINARFEMLRHTDLPAQDVVRTAAEMLPASLEPDTPVAAEAGAEPVAAAVPAPSLAAPLQLPALAVPAPMAARSGAAVRVRPELLDRLVNQTGEVMITRSRMESELVTLRGSLKDLTGNLDRLRLQLRDVELQAETQMQSRLAQAKDANQSFDPLEFDRFTRVQELTRMMAESVNDVATVQRNLQRAVEATEDSLVAQARQTRELQRDLLRTRMVEFEGISERLYRVVRQASKETGKQVRLDITGGNIEMDRGVLDRMTGAFEHLLRNCVVHGIETPEQRLAAGKPAEGRIEIRLKQELNDVGVTFQDDGAGLDLDRLRSKAEAQGFVTPGTQLSDDEAAQLIFLAGLSTASEVSALAGRGVGMDVVRNDVVALGGRIMTHSRRGEGTSFELVLPLTTAVTQVVMLRAGALTWGVPSTVVEIVRRVGSADLAQAYTTGTLRDGRRGRALLLGWRPAAIISPFGRDAVAHAAGGHLPQCGAACGHARGRGAGQPGSGGQEPGPAALAPARSGRYLDAGIRRRCPDLQPGGAGHGLRRERGRVDRDPAGPGGSAAGDGAGGGRRSRGVGGAPGAGGRRFDHGSPRHPAPVAARGLSRVAGRRWPAGTGTPAAGAADGGAVGHRNATHGWLRPGAQHPGRCPPLGLAGDHDHLAHRREAPRACPRAGCQPLPGQAVLGRRVAGPDCPLHPGRDRGLRQRSDAGLA